MSPCQPTCSEPSAPINCPYSAREGCVCPPGQITEGDQCVGVEQCGCTDFGGESREVCGSIITGIY